MEKTTLYLPKELQRELRETARREGRPQAALVREALDTYLLELRPGTDRLDSFLGDLESGAFALHCGERDLARVRALIRRYDNLPLGFANATVIACAEGRGGQVLTFDRRDFDISAREGTITVLVVPNGAT